MIVGMSCRHVAIAPPAALKAARSLVPVATATKATTLTTT
jgi:hypothetical protein